MESESLPELQIADLRLGRNKGVITTRVEKKSEIKEYNGVLFKIALSSESGVILAIGYTEETRKFYHSIEQGRVYYITNVYHQKKYVIAFSHMTDMQLCEENINIPYLQLEEFTSNRPVAELKNNSIIARVCYKTEIIPFHGRFLNLVLVGEKGEIGATAFKNECDKINEIIEENKMYTISDFIVRLANKEFSSLKNDVEIIFTSKTDMQPYEGEMLIPELQYDLINISKIVKEMEPDDIIDTIGICTFVDELVSFNAVTTRRYVVLTDQSDASVHLTLWGNEAEQFKGTVGTVILLKRARVNYWHENGNEIMMNPTTIMKLNPDITECHQLRIWYENQSDQRID